MRKAEYSRGINSSSMILTEEKNDTSEPDIRKRAYMEQGTIVFDIMRHDSIEMFRYNEIPCFLKMRMQEKDNSIQFCYDITSRKSLDHMLEYKTLDDKMLLKILYSLDQACIQVENYMLTEDDILLDPEMIFLESDAETVWYCYLPGNQIAIGQQFQEFTEYLLQHVEHNNEKAVQLAYGVYQRAAEGQVALHTVLSDFKRGDVIFHKDDEIKQEIISEIQRQTSFAQKGFTTADQEKLMQPVSESGRSGIEVQSVAEIQEKLVQPVSESGRSGVGVQSVAEISESGRSGVGVQPVSGIAENRFSGVAAQPVSVGFVNEMSGFPVKSAFETSVNAMSRKTLYSAEGMSTDLESEVFHSSKTGIAADQISTERMSEVPARQKYEVPVHAEKESSTERMSGVSAGQKYGASVQAEKGLSKWPEEEQAEQLLDRSQSAQLFPPLMKERKKVFKQKKTAISKTSHEDRRIRDDKTINSSKIKQKEVARMQAAEKLKSLLRKKFYTSNYQNMEEEPIFEEETEEMQLINPTVCIMEGRNKIQNRFVYQGMDRTRDFDCIEGKMILGSNGEECDICIPLPMISRVHARIEVNAKGAFLEDMNSTNGTWINGELLKYREKYVLKQGDIVSIAGENYSFH